MIYTELTKMAMNLCFEKHKNQVDKSGNPYPFHPFHVAESMTDEYSTCVALLHDIIEDTDTTSEELLGMGFPNEIVEAIKLLSHDSTVNYLEYVRGLKSNQLCKEVKLSDLKHNSDLTRLSVITESDLKRVEKYKKAIAILEE